ncbi:hypothetical protein [Roseibium sp.]|uniref:hypothetical protein n=1 Tax=Roseibium sp. TaxID=1936156 RepID=UPI003BA9FF5A
MDTQAALKRIASVFGSTSDQAHAPTGDDGLLPGQIAGALQPHPYPSMTEWPEDVLTTIRYRQATSYREVSRALGIEGGAAAAFERLRETPRPGLTPEQFRDQMGWQSLVSDEELEAAKQTIAEADAAEPKLPKFALEDELVRQRWFRIQTVLEEQAMRHVGQPLHLLPYIATLPEGDINARVVPTLDGDNYVIFYDHGMMRYLRDFAALVCWFVPPIDPKALMDDRAITQLPRSHTFPPGAIDMCLNTLRRYIYEGTPEANAPYVPVPQWNRHLFVPVFQNMLSFVVIHEQGHVRLGHYATNRFGPSPETEADGNAAFLISYQAMLGGQSWSVPFWCVDLALIAFRMLDNALCVLEHGRPGLRWKDEKYPAPEERRIMLRDYVPGDIPEVSRLATGCLIGMNNSLFAMAEDQITLFLVSDYMKGLRPSPMWNGRIRRTWGRASQTP